MAATLNPFAPFAPIPSVLSCVGPQGAWLFWTCCTHPPSWLDPYPSVGEPPPQGSSPLPPPSAASPAPVDGRVEFKAMGCSS